jgi:hypothetical protein
LSGRLQRSRALAAMGCFFAGGRTQAEIERHLGKAPCHALGGGPFLVIDKTDFADQSIACRVGEVVPQILVIRQVDLRGQMFMPWGRNEEVDMLFAQSPTCSTPISTVRQASATNQ